MTAYFQELDIEKPASGVLGKYIITFKTESKKHPVSGSVCFVFWSDEHSHLERG